MDKKNIPLLMMLVAGAVTWIITFVQKYQPLTAYLILFGVMVLFYAMGTLIKWMFISFERRNAEAQAQSAEGLVTEEEEREEQ